jgi:hypothetical protein
VALWNIRFSLEGQIDEMSFLLCSLFSHYNRKYCFFRRTGSDIYAFDDLFPKRDWHHAVVPSNAAIVLRERLSLAYPFASAIEVQRKLYKKVCIYEGMPLSEKG